MRDLIYLIRVRKFREAWMLFHAQVIHTCYRLVAF